MRLSLISLLAIATAVCAEGTGCGPDEVKSVVASISCGNNDSILGCLKTNGDLTVSGAVESCFIIGGCTREDAASFLRSCNIPGPRKGLKKRKENKPPADDEDEDEEDEDDDDDDDKKKTKKQTATRKTTKTPKTHTKKPATKTTKEATTKAPPKTTDSTTEASTTEKSKTTSAPSTTTSSSSLSSTTSSSTTSNTRGTTAAAVTSTTTGLACSTTKTITTSACSVSAGKTITCTPTTVVSATCAPGNICFNKSDSGADVCMKRSPPLPTSGIVVAVFLGLGLVSAIGFIVAIRVMASKKARGEKAALLTGGKRPMDDIEGASKPYKIGAGGEGDEDSEPLVPTAAGGNYRTAQQGQGYFSRSTSGGGTVPSSPLGPGRQLVPQIQLHQGLGTLGQDGGAHWSQDYNARR